MMENWQKKRSDYETEAHLQKACEDYLDILKAQGKVWYWHDDSNDKSLVDRAWNLLSKYFVPLSEKTEEWLYKRLGVKLRRNRGGLPDLVVWVKKKDLVDLLNVGVICRSSMTNVYTFELKSPKGSGKLTPGQKDFMAFLGESMNTHHILNDFDKFKEIIDGL